MLTCCITGQCMKVVMDKVGWLEGNSGITLLIPTCTLPLWTTLYHALSVVFLVVLN